jgi:hypothetical protein
MLHATSETHPIRVDVVPTDDLPGKLGVTFAPGKKDASGSSRVRWDRDLATDLRDLRERFGTDLLVPLLRGYEYELLGIPDLIPRAQEQDMRVRAFEIDDVSVPAPEATGPFRDLIAELHGELAAGRNVTVHCRGGLGRSGTVAACLLVRDGVPPKEAVARVRAHRPGAVETREQERYVHDYATWRRSEGTSSAPRRRT